MMAIRPYILTSVFLLVCGFCNLNQASANNGRLVISSPDVAKALRKDGVTLLMRHGDTVVGQKDQSEILLLDTTCKGQRRLSEKGLQRLIDTGKAFADQEMIINEIRTSFWCRCLNSAKALADGFQRHDQLKIKKDQNLNSLFAKIAPPKNGIKPLKHLIQNWQGPGARLLISHFTNILEFSSIDLKSGEALVFTTEKFTPIGRIRFEFKQDNHRQTYDK